MFVDCREDAVVGDALQGYSAEDAIMNKTLNPYDPAALGPQAPASDVAENRQPTASRVLPRRIRWIAWCGVILPALFIACVMMYGDSHKRALDIFGIVLLPFEFLLVAWCLFALRKNAR